MKKVGIKIATIIADLKNVTKNGCISPPSDFPSAPLIIRAKPEIIAKQIPIKLPGSTPAMAAIR